MYLPPGRALSDYESFQDAAGPRVDDWVEISMDKKLINTKANRIRGFLTGKKNPRRFFLLCIPKDNGIHLLILNIRNFTSPRVHSVK